VGYVEFESVESMPNGLAMNGQVLCGIPVIVQLTQAEKNRLAALAK
jgi:RNA-binding protein 23/39